MRGDWQQLYSKISKVDRCVLVLFYLLAFVFLSFAVKKFPSQLSMQPGAVQVSFRISGKLFSFGQNLCWQENWNGFDCSRNNFS